MQRRYLVVHGIASPQQSLSDLAAVVVDALVLTVKVSVEHIKK